ncbi:MAG: DUF2760 domain-containing protein [Fimbriiglobus sp.]
MTELGIGAGLGALLVGFLLAVAAIARAGSVNNVFLGLTVAGRSRIDPAFQTKLNAILAGGDVPVSATVPQPVTAISPPPVAKVEKPITPLAPPPPPKPTGEAVRLLALLQNEARLVDFLLEDISSAADAQIGQAVKEIHKKAGKVLKDHLTLTVVMGGNDGDTVTVAAGFDPSAVRMIGNVTGQPPFTGTLMHPGWRVKEVKLPALAEGADAYILQPAEVELA